jgi:hypothetical protein
MGNRELLANYIKLNQSFDKILIYNIGTDAGFFSEYNNMILAVLYCLKHKINFNLHSRNANFAVSQGWRDFFKPFCEEKELCFKGKFNMRPYQINKRKAPVSKVLKAITGVEFYTQDLWDLFRDNEFQNEVFNIPELNLYDAGLLEACIKLNSFVWKLNHSCSILIEEYKDSVKLPDNYISMHIRAGDKFIETQLFDHHDYMRCAQNISNNKKAFILTDDYTVIEELNRDYKDWEFFTLCLTSERGYFHQNFTYSDDQSKYLQHIKLFASIEICSRSSSFIGTYSSNIGAFMAMRSRDLNCISLDINPWRIG